MNPSIKFVDSEKSQFFSILKSRVDQYFQKNQLSKHANGFMIFKTVFYLTLSALCYTLIIINVFPLLVQLFLAIILGISMACIGFNVCHDALHGSYSSNSIVNKCLGFLFNVIGANSYLWKITHNQIHHTFTNIAGHDGDIEIAPGLIRVSASDKRNKIQKYQHIYAFFLYSLTSLSWFFRKDYMKFFSEKIGAHKNNHPKIQYFNLFFFKFIYYTIFIIIPLLVLNLTWWQFLIGYLIMNFAEGLMLALVFQLAHLVEGTDIKNPGEDENIEEAWAIHQMRTTANFARKSWLANFLCGGLNLQIEHHLFPKVCHIHYAKISDIVRETALEFNLPYHENKNFFSALKSHYQTLKVMGRASY